MPAQLRYSFYYASRPGKESIYGPTKEVAAEAIKAEVQAFDCQYLKSGDTVEQNTESDESDSDADSRKKEKEEFTLQPITKLACMTIDNLNNLLSELDFTSRVTSSFHHYSDKS